MYYSFILQKSFVTKGVTKVKNLRGYYITAPFRFFLFVKTMISSRDFTL